MKSRSLKTVTKLIFIIRRWFLRHDLIYIHQGGSDTSDEIQLVPIEQLYSYGYKVTPFILLIYHPLNLFTMLCAP